MLWNTSPTVRLEPPMRMIKTAVAAAFLVGAPYVYAQQISSEEFVTMAASSDMFEIQSSQLAMQNSKQDSVRQFAERMVADHTKASQELKAAAAEAKITVPTQMVEKHAAEFGKLKNAQGEQFDAAYVQAQLAAHQEALKLLQSYAQGGDSAPLKAHATKTAPVVQGHLEHAQKLSGQ
jgi:putative membrane protein